MTIPPNHLTLFCVLESLFSSYKTDSERWEGIDDMSYEVFTFHIRDMYYLLSDILVDFDVKDDDELMELSSVQFYLNKSKNS